jgi:hypothetical protein
MLISFKGIFQFVNLRSINNVARNVCQGTVGKYVGLSKSLYRKCIWRIDLRSVCNKLSGVIILALFHFIFDNDV